MNQELKYYIIYKPFQMLSQFTQEGKRPVLGDLYDFPKDVYPVGRLDGDSEGLLILTNDKPLNNNLLKPENQHNRAYYVQVDGDITSEACAELQEGVTIRVKKEVHDTLPAQVRKLEKEPELPERTPPVRYRKEKPTSWISVTLNEGKNRQVRKMTASVGFPTLRLVRYRIEDLYLEHMQPGDVVELSREEIYSKLNLRNETQTHHRSNGAGRKRNFRKPGKRS